MVTENIQNPEILIMMGSQSDYETMLNACDLLDDFGVAYKTVVASAHRSPKFVEQLSTVARKKGIKVIIAGAGYAAHLAGAVAAHTTLPVIGVPLDSSSLNGLDSLLSTAQMPGGVPVATMAIGPSGAKNAAIFALQILALENTEIAVALDKFREEMEQDILSTKLSRKKDSMEDLDLGLDL